MLQLQVVEEGEEEADGIIESPHLVERKTENNGVCMRQVDGEVMP